MAKADRLKKKIKKLEQRLKEAPKQAKKEIKRLKHALEERDRTIESLRRRLREQAPREATGSVEIPASRDRKLALGQKNAWKRHSFLRERYEAHLAAGHDKGQARLLANRDLMERYGEEVGFTRDELVAILS